MESSNSTDSPVSESMSHSASMSPPIVVDTDGGISTGNPPQHVPRKATARPPLAIASQSSTMSSKGEQNKAGMRRLEKQSEVEETDAFLHEQHRHDLLSAASPTTAGGNFPEVPRTVASLDVPGRAASFDSSSLASNGSMPTPQNSIEKQNSLERPARLGYSENSSPAISRDSSTECNPYTDYTGADLEAFIRGHLNKSAKDREVLFSIEQRLSDFVKSGKTQCYSFPQMSSYHRMFVHRVSAFFGLDHNVDQTGKAVIVSLTPNTRVPDFKFRDLCSDLPPPSNNSNEIKKLILKRDSSDDASRQANVALESTLAFGATFHGGTPASSGAGSPRAASVDGSLYPGSDLAAFPGRSYEEREADYQKARRRIFNAEHGEIVQTNNCLGSPSSHPQYNNTVQWGSTDNPLIGPSANVQQISGPYIAKANSFGGTTVHPQALQPQPAQRTIPVNMSQTGSPQSIAASPQGSTLVIPQHPRHNSNTLGVPPGAVYVLAPSVDYVTAGSVIISPQTGEAFLKRPDGSLQPVILGQPPSPTAGSPVQSAPAVPQSSSGVYQMQIPPQQPPQTGPRYMVATSPLPPSQEQNSAQQYTIVGHDNMHEVLNRLSIISSSDLSTQQSQAYPPPAPQYVSPSPVGPPQNQPIILTAISSPQIAYQQNNGSAFATAPASSYQMAPNGQFMYQITAAPNSLLTGAPTSSQLPQSPEVGPNPLATVQSEGTSAISSQQPQQCWILANTSTVPGSDPSQPRQIILVPAYSSTFPNPSPTQPQPHQQSTSGQQLQPSHAQGIDYNRNQASIAIPPRQLYGVHDQQMAGSNQSAAIRAFAAANPPPPVPPRQVTATRAQPSQSQPQYSSTNEL